MKRTSKSQRLWARLAGIERMERGKICRMAGRRHHNHQTWQDGRNVARYVPDGELASLQEAIDGYRLFRKLAEEYADQIIRQTRAERVRVAAVPRAAKKSSEKSRQSK